MVAIDAALEKAIATFAPRLVPSPPGAAIAEVPAEAAAERDAAVDGARHALP